MWLPCDASADRLGKVARAPRGRPMSREEKSKTAAQPVLDLRGVACPLSWAKTKIGLEGLGPGGALTVWLDDPRGVRDIPRAAEAEGYAVDQPIADGQGWRLTIHR